MRQKFASLVQRPQSTNHGSPQLSKIAGAHLFKATPWLGLIEGTLSPEPPPSPQEVGVPRLILLVCHSAIS